MVNPDTAICEMARLAPVLNVLVPSSSARVPAPLTVPEVCRPPMVTTPPTSCSGLPCITTAPTNTDPASAITVESTLYWS